MKRRQARGSTTAGSLRENLRQVLGLRSQSEGVRSSAVLAVTHRHLSRASRLAVVLLVAVALTACANKARSLQVAAAQFEAEANGAIEALDAMHQAEIAPPPRTPAEASTEFARNVLGLDGNVTPQNLPVLRDPYSVDMPDTEAAWMSLLREIRSQYAAFSAIFSDLERASFTARDVVKEAKPYAEILTVQMASFAQVVQENPPAFLQRRSALIAKSNEIKDDQNLIMDDKLQQLREIYDAFEALSAEEKDMQRLVVERCLKAATIGHEILRQIEAYDELSTSDIAEALSLALSSAESLTDQDLTQLRGKVDTIIGSINNDPQSRALANTVLTKIQGIAGSSVNGN